VRVLAFLSGWTTLGLEVLWTRMFAQVLQNSVYTFAVILVTFLLSLALGAGVARVLAKRTWHPAGIMVTLLVGSALLVALSPFLFAWETDGLGYVAAESGFEEYVLRVFGAAAVVLLLPTAWLGVVFPYLIKVAEAWRWSAGRTVGQLVALNTLGAVVGSIVAGFVLLGSLGLWNSLRLVAAVYLAAALALALRGRRRRIAASAAPVAGMALLVSVLDASRLPLVSIDPEGRRERLVAVLEGTDATVAVVDRPGSRRIKLNNHYGLGGSQDWNQEARQAHIPLVLHPDPHSVFFLGLGTGITAGASLRHPLDRVLVAELVPEVVQASRRYFTPWLHGLFEDPRASVLVEDGRNLLLGTSEHFDVIVADLFLPWKAGTGNLYARELYAAAAERLAPGGICAQWLLLIQLSQEEFGAIAHTFVDVFPRVTLWRGNYRTTHPLVLLVGERDPAPLDPRALERRLAAARGSEPESKPLGVGRSALPETSDELLLYYQGNLSRARSLLEAYPVNSDDRPFIEYSSPITHRRKRTHESSAFRGRNLVAFYDAIFEAAPPERDPYLAALDPGRAELPRAGLELYRSRVLERLGDGDGAAAALERYEGAVGKTR